MVKCGICGGEAPKQPCITEEGNCDICGKKVMLAEQSKEKDKVNKCKTSFKNVELIKNVKLVY